MNNRDQNDKTLNVGDLIYAGYFLYRVDSDKAKGSMRRNIPSVQMEDKLVNSNTQEEFLHKHTCVQQKHIQKY